MKKMQFNSLNAGPSSEWQVDKDKGTKSNVTHSWFLHTTHLPLLENISAQNVKLSLYSYMILASRQKKQQPRQTDRWMMDTSDNDITPYRGVKTTNMADNMDTDLLFQEKRLLFVRLWRYAVGETAVVKP